MVRELRGTTGAQPYSTKVGNEAEFYTSDPLSPLDFNPLAANADLHMRPIEHGYVADDDGDLVESEPFVGVELVPDPNLLHGGSRLLWPGDRALLVQMDAGITREEAKRLLTKMIALIEDADWRDPPPQPEAERSLSGKDELLEKRGRPLSDEFRASAKLLMEVADWLDANYEDDAS
jgi:hypothetical protein